MIQVVRSFRPDNRKLRAGIVDAEGAVSTCYSGNHLGTCYISLNQFAKTIKYYEQGLSIALNAVRETKEIRSIPKFSDFLVDIMDCNINNDCGLGECYESLGMFDKDIHVYKRGGGGFEGFWGEQVKSVKVVLLPWQLLPQDRKTKQGYRELRAGLLDCGGNGRPLGAGESILRAG
jgi:hypothetical protein